MLGQTISHYQIIEKLGAGGMGVVYKALDTKLNRFVALKFLPLELTHDPEAVERFVNEAQTASSLDHANICTIHEINETEEGQLYIVMTYYAGETLEKKVTSNQLSVDSAIDIAMQAAQGLLRAHEAGITHRDIKPSNLIITPRGEVKIIDFGLAKLAGQSRLTKSGSTPGTVAYMSPEQVQGKPVDQRTDIWSLGVVLYEMLTGQLPLRGENEAATIYAIVNEAPKLLAEHRPEISAGLQKIVDKALTKNLENRYQYIDDLLADLKLEKSGTAELIKPATKVEPLKSKWTKKTYFAIAGVLFALLLVIFLLQRPPVKTVITTHKQITFDGNANRPAISPDGQFIAYVLGKEEVQESKQMLMIKDLKGGPPLEIFSGTGFWNLRWSPDGSEIAFYATINDSSYGIFLVPRLGGSRRHMRRYFNYFCWSPDGSQIAGANMDKKRIWFTDKSTQDTTSIALSGSFTWMRDIDWSPLEHRIVFLTQNRKGSAIWTIRTDGSEQQKVVTDSVSNLLSPHWSVDGKAIYYLKGLELMKIKVSPATGKAEAPPQILQSGLQAGRSFAFSKDNKYLLYTRELRYSNLWLINRGGKDDAAAVQTQALTTGTSYNNTPRISPEGRRVAFSRGDPTISNIFTIPLEGGPVQQLTFLNNSDNFAPAWSPDGKEIAFLSNQGGKYRIWRISANGGTPRPFEKSEASEQGVFVAWSPGAQILYERPGSRNLHFLNPKTEEERPLFPNDSLRWVFWTRYSPDGKKVAVYCNRPPQYGVWLISLTDASQVFLQKGPLCPVEWSTDGKWIYAWNTKKKPYEILKISVADSSSTTWLMLPFDDINEWGGMSMTPDGKRIVCNVDEIKSDVWVMENFDPEIK